MFVRRVIEKEVTCCVECPYYKEERDMGAIIPLCEAIDNREDCWASVLHDINWLTMNNRISSQCPLKKQLKSYTRGNKNAGFGSHFS